MRRLIAGLIGIAGIFLATHVYAAGTSSVSFEEIRLTDNCGTLTITQGSQTVTTNLTAVDIVITQMDGYGSTTVDWRATPSGAGFTIQGWLAGTNATKYVGTASGYWFAIDK